MSHERDRASRPLPDRHAILSSRRIRRVVLVTQAFHMPRARQLFEAAGLEVIPAPTDFKGPGDGPLAFYDFLPQARAMQTSYYALHEWLGLAWMALAAAAALAPPSLLTPSRHGGSFGAVAFLTRSVRATFLAAPLRWPAPGLTPPGAARASAVRTTPSRAVPGRRRT